MDVDPRSDTREKLKSTTFDNYCCARGTREAVDLESRAEKIALIRRMHRRIILNPSLVEQLELRSSELV